MAAPSYTAPQAPPAGAWLMPEGYKILVTFANKPSIRMWERDVKPPGFDTGDKINITSQRNNRYRTFAAPQMVELNDMTGTYFFDPDVFSDINGLAGVNQSISVTWPDGSKLSFWGFLKKFEPSELKEKEAPTAAVEICVTNWDPANQVEAGPVFTQATGT